MHSLPVSDVVKAPRQSFPPFSRVICGSGFVRQLFGLVRFRHDVLALDSVGPFGLLLDPRDEGLNARSQEALPQPLTNADNGIPSS